MQQAIQTGVTLGLTLAILLGPVFFALIQTSISKGFWKGAVLAVGISLSDSIYIFASNLVIQVTERIPNFDFYLGMVGGVVLTTIGITTFRKKATPPAILDEQEEPSKGIIIREYISTFLKGFLINFAHPGVLIFWLAVVASLSTQTSFDAYEKGVLFTATILTVLSTDLIKAFLAHRISPLISEKNLTLLNKVMGLILVVFGILMFLDTFGVIALTKATPGI